MATIGRLTIESILVASFALSGAAALIAQTVWQRELIRLVGATTPATAVVYAGVMAGLGIGALLGNVYFSRNHNSINALRFLSTLEAICCAFAVIYVLLFHSELLFSLSGLSDETARFALAFFIAAAPSLAMGATWPAAVASCQRISLRPADLTGWLYHANLGGALVGAIGGVFALIPAFGLCTTLGISGSFNFVCCLSTFLLSFAATKLIEPGSKLEEVLTEKVDAALPQLDCLLVFLSAFVTLSIEVTLTRLFTLVVGSSTYSVGIVLSGTLLAMYAASFMGTRRFVGLNGERSLVAIFASIAALLLFAEASFLNFLPQTVLFFSRLAGEIAGLSGFAEFICSRVFLCLFFVFIPVFFMAGIFPLTLREGIEGVGAKTARAGWLYAASTFGAVFGALLSGLYLIPSLSEKFASGLQVNLMVSACVSLLISAFVAAQQITIAQKQSKFAGIVFLSSAGVLGILAVICPLRADTFMLSQGVGFLPSDRAKSFEQILNSFERERKNTSMLFYKEGLNSSVSVQDFPANNIRALKNDGKVEAAIPIDLVKSAPTSDYPTQLLLACLPYVLGSSDKKDCLVIGCGSGATYGALQFLPSTTSLTVSEIEKTVYDASKYFLPEQKRAERADVQKQICDARSQLAFNSRQYDLIVSQPAEPWVNGAGDLYTSQFFKLVSSRLKPQGVFCQWLQLYAIDDKHLLILLNTIQKTFPSTYVFHPHGSGEILIVSINTQYKVEQNMEKQFQIHDDAKLDVEHILRAMREESLQAKLRYCNIVSIYDLLSMLVLNPQKLDELLWRKLSAQRILLNTDDNLLSEYALPQHIFDKDDRIESNLELLHFPGMSLSNCLKNWAEKSADKAEFLDRVALSSAGYFQNHPAEKLDDAALSLAYEAWTLSESASTAAACDAISQMTGRLGTERKLSGVDAEKTGISETACFWLGQSALLSNDLSRARALFERGAKMHGAHSEEFKRILKSLDKAGK